MNKHFMTIGKGHFAGVMAGIIVWRREGRHLRSSDIKKIPYVGKWLAEHVPRWRDNDPRKRAATAAERRARVRSFFPYPLFPNDI